MELYYMLQNGQSKVQTDKIVAWVGIDQQRFDQLFQLLFDDCFRIVQRASWPISYCAIKHPQLLKKHYTKLLRKLDVNNQRSAVKRNILRILDQIENIPSKYHGQIMNYCFKCIENPNEEIAPQAFSLGILKKLSSVYPEIKSELKSIIEIRLPNASAAFKSRAKKILKSVD